MTEETIEKSSLSPQKAPAVISKRILYTIMGFQAAITLTIGGFLMTRNHENGPYCKALPMGASKENITLPNELKLNEYSRILDSYPSLKNIRNTLAEMEFSPKGKEKLSGYHVLIDFLAYHYDLDLPYQKLRERIDAYFRNFEGLESSHKLYLLNVAQSLWIEQHHTVGWSLKDYSEAHIEALFYEPTFHGSCTPTLPSLGEEYFGHVPEEPQLAIDASYQLYHLARNIIGKETMDQEEATQKAIRWMQSNFFHASGEYPWGVYADGRTKPNVHLWNAEVFAPKNLERFFEERVAGCDTAALTLKGILRALNIPAFNVNNKEMNMKVRVKGHTVTYLPRSRKFVHGDHLITKTLYSAKDIMFSAEEYSDYTRHRDTSRIGKMFDDEDDLHRGALQRNGNNLYIGFPPQTKPFSSHDLQLINAKLPQFQSIKNTDSGLPKSALVPIKTLPQLSQLQ